MRTSIRPLHLPVLLLWILAVAKGDAAAQLRREFTEVHMGMRVRMVLYAPDDSAARTAARATFARIAQLDQILSDYIPQSELRRLEAHAGEWVEVSTDLFAVLARSLEIAGASNGAFDPTVGPLIALWRAARVTKKLPPQTAFDSTRALIGYHHVALDSARRSVRFGHPGLRLDLGGIAKGYVLQQALATLRAHRVASALLQAGGDIVVGAAPPGTRGWQIETPGADAAFRAKVTALAHTALAVSGSAAQYVEIDGVRYSHIIDPRSGNPLTHQRTTYVIARDAAVADALSTALSVLDPDAGRALAAKYDAITTTSAAARRPSDHRKSRTTADHPPENRNHRFHRH